MAWPHGGAESILRNNETLGNPATPLHEPNLEELRDLLVEFQDRFDAGIVSSTVDFGGNGDTAGDSVVFITRDINNGVGDVNVGSNAHGFVDLSTIDRDGDIGINSFYANPTVGGTFDYDHLSAFQFGATLATTGDIARYFGFNSLDLLVQTQVDQIHFIFLQPPVVSGAGHVDLIVALNIGDMVSAADDSVSVRSTGASRMEHYGPILCRDVVLADHVRQQQQLTILSTVGAGTITVAMADSAHVWRTGAQGGAFADTLPAASGMMDIIGRDATLLSSGREIKYRNSTSGGFTCTINDSADGSFVVSGTRTVAAGKIGVFREIVASIGTGVVISQLIWRRMGTFDDA